MTTAVPKHLLEDMTWPEARIAAAERRVVLLPVGAIEQHGPHLPVDVDNRIVTWLCDEAARRRPDLLMSVPPIHYGFNEHNMGFPGTVSVEVRNFLGYVGDVVRSFVRQGHTRVVLVNGHGSNSMLCALIAREVVNGSEDALVAAVDHWSLARELGAKIRESGRGGIAHACEYETSWYLHLHPEGVDLDVAVPDMLAPRSQYAWVDTIAGDGPVALIDDWSRISNGSGVEGDPTTANADKGGRFAEEEIRVLTAFAEEFAAMDVPPRRNYTARGTDANPWYLDADAPETTRP
ncbi:MAG: creatinine amidohydrolase [Solirubrobacteraceae bacterium]|nr:creatinine amidohydrolase [Solirubrobacteraceae bacterium]